MAEFAENILKTDAQYYKLSRATLRDGLLHIYAGGYASTEITSKQLTNLTEYFQVTFIATQFCDSYNSNIRIRVYAKDKDGKKYNYTFFPCDTHGGMYIQPFQLKAVAYETLTYRIETDVEITVSLWELCPEAQDINLQTIIDGVQQSLPRLLYDYNTWPLTVELAEATVGLITFRLLDKTDLQGHFIMSFFASEAAILTVRFYTNEIEELFAPLTYDIKKGYNSIGIPHCYLHRSAGIYSVMATAQVSAGLITIPTRGVLYSIDGGYLARRELDVAMDVRDLAVRQLAESYGPDEVWLAGIDAGEILVRKRDYNENNPNVAWTAVASFGRGTDVALEFDGIWALRAEAEQCTLETEEEPWFFWVDPTGVLYGQLGLNAETKITIDTDVKNISACRGYSSRISPELDQGLIIAYSKTNGTIFYKQYVYDVSLGYKVWLAEMPLYTEETWDSIKVTRLNDYRVCFTLSNDTHNLWLLSERTYVNQAAPPQIKSDYINSHWNGISLVDPSYSYAGVERVLPDVRAQSEFIIDFPCNVYLFDSPYQILTSVKLNGVEILDYKLKYTFEAQGNSLIIKFERSFSGIFTFTIAPWVLGLSGNGVSYVFTSPTTYAWEIYVTIVAPEQNDSHRDTIAGATPSIIVRPLRDLYSRNKDERADVIRIDTLSIAPKALKDITQRQEPESKQDRIVLDTISIVPTQTGDQPI